MKLYKPFDVRDRFKGFKSKEKPESSNLLKKCIDYSLIQYGDMSTVLTLEKFQAAYRLIMETPRQYTIPEQYMIDFYKQHYGILPNAILPNGIQMGDPIFDEMNSILPSCEHEPIDIGFVTPKMVCKKCDKDIT